MRIGSLISLSVVLFSFSALAAVEGTFNYAKTISSTVAPANSNCSQFSALKMSITNSSGGYDVTPTFQLPDMAEPTDGPSFHCNVSGASATCANKSSFVIDLHAEGIDAAIVLSFGKAMHRWTSANSFNEHSSSSFKCEGSDCASILGTTGNHICTMNSVVQYKL